MNLALDPLWSTTMRKGLADVCSVTNTTSMLKMTLKVQLD